MKKKCSTKLNLLLKSQLNYSYFYSRSL